MFSEISIANFRCFVKETLSGLSRINVIVGPNGSGKTALMEAVFLACGANPELSLRLKGYRGLASFAVSNTRAAYEALWRDMFYRFEQDRPIQIELKYAEGASRSLSIQYDADAPVLIEFDDSAKFPKESLGIVPIVFEWTLPSGRKIQVTPQMAGNGLRLGVVDGLEPLPTSFYATHAISTQDEPAQQFSALSIRNEELQIVNALKTEYPMIEGLSVQIWGGLATVFATVPTMPEKVPMHLLSSGVTKLVSILLGIAIQRGGIVCIDELENGFYYDRLPSIWSLLLTFAKQYDVQLFVSTHSWECLQAAAKHAEANPAEFSLIQAPMPGQPSPIRVTSGESFANAVRHEMDVR